MLTAQVATSAKASVRLNMRCLTVALKKLGISRADLGA